MGFALAAMAARGAQAQGLGDEVVAPGATVAAVERERVLADTERRISEALVALTVSEEVSVQEAAALCGLEVREANRLRRLHHHHHTDQTSSPSDPVSAP